MNGNRIITRDRTQIAFVIICDDNTNEGLSLVYLMVICVIELQPAAQEHRKLSVATKNNDTAQQLDEYTPLVAEKYRRCSERQYTYPPV